VVAIVFVGIIIIVVIVIVVAIVVVVMVGVVVMVVVIIFIIRVVVGTTFYAIFNMVTNMLLLGLQRKVKVRRSSFCKT